MNTYYDMIYYEAFLYSCPIKLIASCFLVGTIENNSFYFRVMIW